MPLSIPFTTTVSSHGLLIRANGITLGGISSFSESQQRNVKGLYEFGAVTVGGGQDIQGDSGEAYEGMPGTEGLITLSIDRQDLYTSRFEQAFGTNDLEMLTKQSSAISLISYIVGPQKNLSFGYVYYGVWFTQIGRALQAEGDKVVMTKAQAVATRRRNAPNPVTGS